MKIVQITQSYHPRPGGVTEHVHHATQQLRRRGHDVTVVTANFGNESSAEPGVVRIGKNILVPINGAWVNMTTGARLFGQLKRVLHSLAPDIVHTHCPLAPTLPLMALKAAPQNSLLVGTFHAAAERSLGYQLCGAPLRPFFDRLDVRVAVSEAARSLAHQYFAGDYEIIPNGVDCSRFSPANEPIAELRDDAFNVLFVGRIDKRKGLKYLFHAVTLLSRQVDRRVRLIVVGDDGLRRRLLPRLPRGVELVFTGVVSNEMLPRYFASGDVFCSPAIDRESFGIVLLEAMASGIPVVGTGIPGYLTILRQGWNSLVVRPKDPEALSSALQQLMNDDRLRWTLRNNGLAFARRYDWECVADQLEILYRQYVPAWIAPAVNEPVNSPMRVQKA